MTSVCFSHHSDLSCLSPFDTVCPWRFCRALKLSPTLLSAAQRQCEIKDSKRQEEERKQYLCMLISRALMWVLPYLMDTGRRTSRRHTRTQRETHSYMLMHPDTDDLAVNQHVWMSPLCVGWIKGISNKLNLTSSNLLCVEILNRNKQSFSNNKKMKWLCYSSVSWVKSATGCCHSRVRHCRE